MIRLPLILILLLTVPPVFSQSEIRVKKLKGTRERTLDIHRIIEVTGSRGTQKGFVISVTDSSMTMNQQYFDKGVMRDTLVTMRFSDLTSISYCKRNDLLKCDKRRRHRATRTTLNTCSALCIGVAVTAAYGGAWPVIVGGVGAAFVFRILGALLKDRKYYLLGSKWQIIIEG